MQLFKQLLALCFLALPTVFYAQNSSVSYQLSNLMEQIEIEQNASRNDQEIHIVVKGNVKNVKAFLDQNTGTMKYQYDDLMAIRIPLKALRKLINVEGLIKAEIHNTPFDVMDATAIGITSADKVHSGNGTLQQAYTGNGVVVGIIDSGIDPTHPDFKNNDGTTRILAFWDQNDFSGTLSPYGYGKEYTAADIDAGLMSNYLDTTYGGHGTAVTGMAAGGGKARPDVKGMAPEADIVVVGIRPSALDYVVREPYMLLLVDAINYIFTVAEAAGKPAVINMSLGGIEGSHDAQDLPTQLIEKMLDEKNGRALVVSAGNSGTVRHHVQYQVNGDTAFTWFRNMYSKTGVCKRDSGVYMSFYGDESQIKNLRINIAADNRQSCCAAIGETGFRAFKQTVGQKVVYPVKNSSNNTIAVATTFLEKIGETYGYFAEIKTDNNSFFWRFQFTGTGKADGWAGPTNRRSCNSDFIYNPLALGTTALTRTLGKYVEPDFTQNIGNAYACSEKVITVGAYSVRSEMYDVDSIRRTFPVLAKDRAVFSSIGPTRTGATKPDITGPGSRILTAQASQELSSMARSNLYLGGLHSVTGGTSFSSPAVAGIVALYLEKKPNASYAEIKRAITSTSDQDAQTGAVMPNNENGYGRINAYQMLLYQDPVGVENQFTLEFLVYPNPSSGQFHIQLPKSKVEKNYAFKVYDFLGKVILEGGFVDYNHQFNLSQSGVYILEISDLSGNNSRQKIVLN